MFINLTNHASELWSASQLKATSTFGDIVDMPFPNVPPHFSETDISELAEIYVSKVLDLNPTAVLCQGEMTLTYCIVSRLLKAGIIVLAACSERKTTEQVNADGASQKVSIFEFCRYRAYINEKRHD